MRNYERISERRVVKSDKAKTGKEYLDLDTEDFFRHVKGT